MEAYLDNSSTTKVYKEAVEKMQEAMEVEYGNPSSLHKKGVIAEEYVKEAKKVIANTHSGWRGTLQRISIKTVKKMVKEFGCHPKDIICCICPSIRKCHFEVDIDVKDMFEKEFKDLENTKFIDIEKENKEKTIHFADFIEEKIENTKWHIDTVLINKIMLQKEGLEPENIIDSGICSVCHSDSIHSYRIEKKNYNTETAVIELK